MREPFEPKLVSCFAKDGFTRRRVQGTKHECRSFCLIGVEYDGDCSRRHWCLYRGGFAMLGRIKYVLRLRVRYEAADQESMKSSPAEYGRWA